MKSWLPELLGGLKRQKTISDGSKSKIYRCYIKHSFIYLLVPVLSIGSVKLCIMCVRTKARQKSIEGYVALC